MANEIRLSQQLAVQNGNLNFAYPNGSPGSTVDQSAEGGPTPGVVSIGTTEESEAFSELSTLGYVLMHNLDDTNYVQWGFATGVYGGRMGPGEMAGPFRLEPSTTIYLKANAAACKVMIAALED